LGKLIYEMNVSLDGYVEGQDGDIGFATVDEELHTWFNDQARGVAASLYGTRMWRLMSDFWPHAPDDPEAPPHILEFAEIWARTPKIVFSSSLASVEHGARLARGDVADALAALRAEFDGDLDVGGPTLAASFIRRGLVDEYRLVVHPVVLGGGKPFFPPLETPLRLELHETRAFRSGAVYVGYRAIR
jgi:dihydrofolate reductase